MVDVAAPGGDTRTAGVEGGILSTLNTGTSTPLADSYRFYQGTSMATPHVAGVTALMLSKNPTLSPDEVESKLKSTARAFPASCTSCGSGIVDASAAVDAAGARQAPQGPTMSEREWNGAIGSPNLVVTPGTTVFGDIRDPSDDDYFVVLLPAGKTLTATLAANSRAADYDMIGYDQLGTELTRSENRANTTDAVTMANTGTTTVQRFVRVKYAGGTYGPINGKYNLKLTW
jgi:serine protease